MAVQLFLNGQIRFIEIPQLLEQTLESHCKFDISRTPSLDEIQQLDQWTRQFVEESSRKIAISTHS